MTFESFGRKPLNREADLLARAKAKTTGLVTVEKRSGSRVASGERHRASSRAHLGSSRTTPSRPSEPPAYLTPTSPTSMLIRNSMRLSVVPATRARLPDAT
jgi:hypothetical protein